MAEPVHQRTRKLDQEALAEVLKARAAAASVPKYGVGTFGYSTEVTYGPPKKPK